MRREHFVGAGVALASCLGTPYAANAATVSVGTIVVPATSPTGISEVFGPISDNDTISFSVSGTPFLQDGPSYGTNAAGVVTVYGQTSNTPVGGSLIDAPEGSGFTYGALIATLNGVSKQVFTTDTNNGLGSSSPPTTLTFSGTVASLFGANVAGSTNVLTFRVDDSDYSNNAGFFTLTGTASAVPEPASWAMMIIGFGMIGAGLRYRRRATILRYV